MNKVCQTTDLRKARYLPGLSVLSFRNSAFAAEQRSTVELQVSIGQQPLD